jgi:hypothetical protein
MRFLFFFPAALFFILILQAPFGTFLQTVALFLFYILFFTGLLSLLFEATTIKSAPVNKSEYYL